MTDMASAPILCFGEVLWDSLPQGLFPGGAPVNVAYHLKRLGARALPVTAVGNDFLGHELLRRMQVWGLETDFVSVRQDKPTGTVQAQLDAKGSATYTITEDVAWDWIEVSSDLQRFAAASSAIVYGTLSQRSQQNLVKLESLLHSGADAMKVYDVNLRPPFDSPEIVWRLAGRASLIKLNDDELCRLLVLSREVSLEEGARKMAERTGCPRICVTAGAKGAGLLYDDSWLWAESQPIQVKDTIGAGDSFLAALVHGLLTNPDPAQALARASRLAEFVASSSGATPAYSINAQGAIAAV